MQMKLPESGTPWDELRSIMISFKGNDIDWKAGRAAVYVFDPGQEVLDVAHDAYGLYISENGLGPGAFPSLRQMEKEVIAMALDLQNAPENAAGSMTSGGTESILMAIKACRDRFAEQSPVNGVPEIVAPQSVHPAFDKGAHLMGLKVIRTSLREDLTANIKAMEEHISPRTIMLVGSAPCFPFGLIDPISELSELAEERNLWLHVDACVGGYLAPFVRDNGVDVPAYDFSLPGVRSISADLHKFGYAAKGASTVLYRDKSFWAHQTFTFHDWPCGRMFTPTMAGTRAGGAIAAAWAVMNFLGREGYRALAGTIIETRKHMVEGFQALGLKIWGKPLLSIICFGSEDFDILAAGEEMYRLGWISSRTTDPPGIQLMLSPGHAKVADEYLKDLKQAISLAQSGKLNAGNRDVSYT